MPKTRLKNIPARELPAEWLARLGLESDARVDVTIEKIATHEDGDEERRRFDRKAIERILDGVADLPARDNRTADEIIGYDARGLPL